MVDIVSSEVRSRMMLGIKGKDTKPEIRIRQLLHRAGYRYRLHRKDLPGRPDLVLTRYNAALFVNGCFWHGHEDCNLFRLPKSRQDFWKEKISGNKARDLRKQTELFELGWRVGVVWECTLKGKKALDHDSILKHLEEFIRGDIPIYELRGAHQ
ncbi:very short patch repair endonuclease [Celeribacter sp.]|uniref:very short patch repair endonuclease n=1 Tax=Celeribacter sp. TaxID=1890673 RepID=UPI003A92CE07